MMPSVEAIAPRLLYALAGLLAGVLLSIIYQVDQPEPAPSVVTLATPAKVLTRVERVQIPCETVQAYAPEAKRRISLPEAVRKNPDAHVLASSDVRADERDTRISTVLDTSTGAVDTYAETLPLPWLRPESRGEVGLYYGVKPGQPGMVGRLQARYDVLQIKGSHVGAIGSFDTDGETYAGVGFSYRW